MLLRAILASLRISLFALSKAPKKGEYVKIGNVGAQLDDNPDANGRAQVTMKGGSSTSVRVSQMVKITKEEYDKCDEAWSILAFHLE